MTDFNTIPPTSRMSCFTCREGVILDGWSANQRLAINGLLGIVTGMPEDRRILSSKVGSEPLGKFSTLSDSSTAYQHTDSSRDDPI